MDRFIFTYFDKDREGIFRDLTSNMACGLIDFLPSHKTYQNAIVEKLKQGYLSYKLNSKIEVPFQSVFYNLDSYKYDSANVYHIIVPTLALSKLTVKYLKRFKQKHKNIRLYALVIDSMHASSPHMNLTRKRLFSDVWDKVLTYDKYDAEEYGFTWFGYTYYSSFDFVEPDKTESDIYYVGYNKGGREKIVLDVYDYIHHKGINPRFDVVSYKSVNHNDLIYLRNKISYPQVVSRVKSTNCILEILQNNQKMQSLRYLEAIVYNKKLLTNNENVFELPYYDKRYMKFFHNTKDIDIDWIKAKESINYGYDGRFTPLKLCTFINDLK